VKAVDTNIVARMLLDDDPIQSPLAHRIIGEGAFVPATVLLETAWLLGSRYGFERQAVSAYLQALIEIPSISIANYETTQWALRRFSERGDVGDLMHLAASAGASEFVTFDRSLERDAAPDSPIAIRILG
jgi:predicted nucleic-acid-binding protein